jgi:RND family efflux transporter MFP subunit
MNRNKVIGIIIGIALVVAVVFKLKTNKEIAKGRVFQFDKEQAINVKVDTMKLENVTSEQSFSGTFEPNKETKVSAEIQGKVNLVLVDIGSVVSKGQALIQLDNSLLKLQLQTIEVQIEGLESDVKRYTILAQADAIQGVQLEKAVLGLKSAKVQKATLLEQIYKTTIRAPFHGIITSKLIEEGAFAAPGIPLLQLTDISTLKFTVNVSENDLSKFKLNHNYPVTSDVYSETILLGRAIMIGSKANMGSSFPVQFSLINTNDLKVKSGMFGKVFLKNEHQNKGILIPSSAVIGSDTKPQVYKIKEGKAVLQSISISNKLSNKVQILTGLREGDIIVTNGFINLFNGATITVK